MVTVLFEILTLPKDIEMSPKNEIAKTLAGKCRDMRLEGLKTSPGAFASSYDEEAQRGLGFTMQRLSNPRAAHFVALASEDTTKGHNSHEGDLCALTTRDWIGSLVLMGPHTDAAGISPKSDPFPTMADPRSPDISKSRGRLIEKELHFHLNGMFVVPFARRSGVGMALLRAALDRANSEGRQCSCSVNCSIIVDEWNVSARSLYERCGFRVVAKELYGDDRIALRMELQQTVLEERQ